jgi:hypothetical protein
MESKPWLRWGFVVFSGVALGGCQSPSPCTTCGPTRTPVGKQTMQAAPQPTWPGAGASTATPTQSTPAANMAPVTGTPVGTSGVSTSRNTNGSLMQTSGFPGAQPGVGGASLGANPSQRPLDSASPLGVGGAPSMNPQALSQRLTQPVPPSLAVPPSPVLTPPNSGPPGLPSGPLPPTPPGLPSFPNQ